MVDQETIAIQALQGMQSLRGQIRSVSAPSMFVLLVLNHIYIAIVPGSSTASASTITDPFWYF